MSIPAIKAVDQRLIWERGFNALLVVSTILAALWSVEFATRAWRQSAAPST